MPSTIQISWNFERIDINDFYRLSRRTELDQVIARDFNCKLLTVHTYGWREWLVTMKKHFSPLEGRVCIASCN